MLLKLFSIEGLSGIIRRKIEANKTVNPPTNGKNRLLRAFLFRPRSVLFKGSAEDVKSNERVIESYLGKGLKK